MIETSQRFVEQWLHFFNFFAFPFLRNRLPRPLINEFYGLSGKGESKMRMGHKIGGWGLKNLG